MAKNTAYRQDIDELRAVAILPVILFHTGFRYAPGGFLGVDIFFVISGYLITAHIWRELERGNFSLTGFYERRVRRIVPALVFMLFCASAAAYFSLFPAEMISFQKTVAATVLSASNIYFWQTTNYFSDHTAPLLHTWSLAVEEQFYFVMPLCLMLISRKRRAWLTPALGSLTLLSFLLCLLTYRRFPNATFYLLPQRAWEMLLGGLFSLGILRLPSGRMSREVLAATGLIVVLLFMVHLPASWYFPGPGVLFPCLGAGMILAAGPKGETLTGRLLSLKALSSIGLISYSTYLWHVPLIAFLSRTTRVSYGHVLSKLIPFLTIAQAITTQRLIIVLMGSLTLGFISWKFAEQPIRVGPLKPSRASLFKASALASVVFLGTSEVVLANKGLPGRFTPEVIAITSFSAPKMHYPDYICLATRPEEAKSEPCSSPDPKRPVWLLIGDSHAAHLDYGVHQVVPEVQTLRFIVHGCKPVPVERYGESSPCAADYKRLYGEYLPRHHFDLVILAANGQPHLTFTVFSPP